MKKSIITLLSISIAIFNACAQEKHNSNQKETPAVKTDAVVKSGTADKSTSSTIDELVEHYLHLKNALIADNAKEAASAGKAMVVAMGKVDKSSLTGEQKTVYADVEDDAKEHAEHISENAGDISHQREHFDILSKDIYDLVKVFGSTQTLYKDYCPMYNNNKGAIWLSETKAIKNPYYGKKMLSCGAVKEEIK